MSRAIQSSIGLASAALIYAVALGGSFSGRSPSPTAESASSLCERSPPSWRWVVTSWSASCRC